MTKSPRVFILYALIILYGLAVVALASTILTDHPGTGDEFAIYFQSQIFADGHLSRPSPAVPELFETDYLRMQNGRWFSEHPPLNSLLHSPFFALGLKSWGMGIYAVIFLFVLQAFLRQQRQSLTVTAAALALVAFSPSFLFHSASYYAHVPAALFFMIALYHGQRLHSEGRGLFGFMLALGLLSACRPYDAFLLSPLLLWWAGWKKIKQAGPLDLALAVGLGSIPLGLSLAFGFYTTGGWTVPYLSAAADNGGLFDFHLGLAPLYRAWLLYIETGAWFGPGIFKSGIPRARLPFDFNFGLYLFTAAWLAAFYRALKHRNRLAIISAMGPMLLLLGYSFFDGIMKGRFGGRYLFTAMPLLFIPLAQMVEFEISRLRRAPKVACALALTALYTASIYSTARFFKNDNRRRLQVFLDAERLPPNSIVVLPADFPPWYVRNPPDLNGPLFVRPGTDELRKRLFAAYPERPAYGFTETADASFTLLKASAPPSSPRASGP